MKMKRLKFTSSILALTLLASCAGGDGGTTDSTTSSGDGSSNNNSSTSAIVYKISAGLPDSHFEIAALKEMEAYVEEQTNGGIDIQIYSNNQLGDDKEAIELIQQGVVQMCPSGTSVLGNFESSFNILSLPYLFKSLEDVERIVGGDWGDQLLDSLSGTGLQGLGTGILGLTNISNSVRPIVTADDLTGVKLRCPPNQVLLDFYKEVGASPVSMSFNELFAALQQGVVDGQLNPFTTIYTNNFQEVQAYISKTSDIASLVTFVVNEAEFGKLDPAYQTAIQEGVDIAIAYMAESVEKEEADAEQALLDTGLTQINEVSDETKAELLQRGYSVIEKYGNEANASLFESLKTELGIS